MTTFSDAPTASGHWPFSTCPDCGSDAFVTIEDSGTTVFTCLGCAASWRYLLGYLVSVPAESS